MNRMFAALALCAVAALPATAQDPKKPVPGAAHPGVDQKRVNRAIQAGVEYLKTCDSPGHNQSKDADELILLTLLHANAESIPRFKQMFDKMLTDPLQDTYCVSLQAMVLEEFERVKYQGRIHQCAQFLVDNQCPNGQWSYGTSTTYPDAIPVPRSEVATGLIRKPQKLERGARNFDEPEVGRQKPRVQQHLAVKQNRTGPATGDNSNSQYAALGIRACHDAGIVFPREVIERARTHWIETQEKGEKAGVATGPGAGIPRGWGYNNAEGARYGSMTAGATGAVCIYDFILAIEFRKDQSVLDGIAWLGKNFLVTNNPNRPDWFHLYYLYGVERAGMLSDNQRMGAHDWYMEGANYLLDAQRADGSWGNDADKLNPPSWGTCFAILFLKQATRRLDVASTDRR